MATPLNGHAGTARGFADAVFQTLQLATAPPEAIAAVEEVHDLGSVLSPSQVNTLVDCQARWWYKHGLKLPDPQNGNLALGKAVHEALGANYAQKVETKRDLPVEGVAAVFRDAWSKQAAETDFRDDENPGDLAAGGELLVASYIEEVAPFVEPAAVELEVEGKIGGVRVRGRLDVIDVDGRIVDVKTSAKSPSGIQANYRRQIATYAQLEPRASGLVRLDTLVKTKTVKLVSQSFEINDADRRETATIYPLAQEVMRQGLYIPNRGSNLCSRKHCPFWRRCEADFGGEVAQ